MRRLNRRGGILSLEDDQTRPPEEVRPEGTGDGIVPEGNEEVVDIGDNATSPETDMIEITEDVAEQEVDQADIDEAGEVIEALEGIAEVLRVSTANGGMDKYAAEAICIATDYMYKRVGIKARVMPAMESFGGTSTRIGATKLAMESVKEGIVKVWEIIVAAFKKSIEWAHEFYTKITTTHKGLQKRAEELSAKLKSVGDKAKEEPIKNGRLVKMLSINGEMPSSIVSSAVEVVKLTDVLINDSKLNWMEGIAKVFSESDIGEKFQSEFKIPAVGTSYPIKLSEVSDPEKYGRKKEEGVSCFASEELLGGKTLVIVGNKTELVADAAVSALTNSFRGIVTPSSSKAPGDKDELKVLGKTDIENVCKSVIEITANGISFQQKLEKIAEVKKKMASVIDAMSKKSKGLESEAASGYKSLQKAATEFKRLIDQPEASISVYTLHTSKALLDYVEESLKQYA